MRLKLTEAQASIVELHVLDSAHDDDRAPWWPTLDGMILVVDPARIDDTVMLFIEAANSEEQEPKWARVATGLAAKIRRAA